MNCIPRSKTTSMNNYCTKLKRLTDQLRNIGHLVSESSQVSNLLCILNPHYRYVKPVITSEFPPHTFMSVRSFLILEELSVQHNAIVKAGQALVETHGNRSSGSFSSSTTASNDGSMASGAPHTNRLNNGFRNKKTRDRGNCLPNNGGMPSRSNSQAMPWVVGATHVKAWCRPSLCPSVRQGLAFWDYAPTSPLFQPQQAMTVTHLPSALGRFLLQLWHQGPQRGSKLHQRSLSSVERR
jgi:hypothetical protein